MILADVAAEPNLFGYQPLFVYFMALVCLFVVMGVALVILHVVRSRRS